MTARRCACTSTASRWRRAPWARRADEQQPAPIGGNAVWNEWFAGRIDEVRVYNRALAAADVQADMDRPVTPRT